MKLDGAARTRFWLVYLRTAFAVFVGESAVVWAYVYSTSGEHRFALAGIATLSLAVASVCFILAPVLAPRSWCPEFSFAWTLLSGAALTMCVWLDSGLSSPLLFLLVLPVFYGGLAFVPTRVAICVGASLLEVGIVAVTDRGTGASHGSLLMVSAATAGLGLVAWLTALHRSRLERVSAELTEQLTALAITDDLTGCLNHRAFGERMNEEIDRAVRYGSPLSLVVADIDDFKKVNDTLGHAVGDASLVLAGQSLRAMSRVSDVVGRIGGDEFAVLLPSTALADAALHARRVFDPTSDRFGRLTFSAGVASLDPSDANGDRLFRDADAALYEAKRAGRRRVAVADHVDADADITTPRSA